MDRYIGVCNKQMRCADGTHQMWLVSQSDVLAEDWFIVD